MNVQMSRSHACLYQAQAYQRFYQNMILCDFQLNRQFNNLDRGWIYDDFVGKQMIQY